MSPKNRILNSRQKEHTRIDNNINFKSVGGLEEHKKCLREMILFPLMYPKFFKRFDTRPPKGVLFYGPPGTGKTLMAKALANECRELGGTKVSFFIQKGADIMSKWYGESEKHLKACFEEAYKMSPSIIFFDEIDALAPARADTQGEAYASVVSTLLVEMDGLWERGNVIVIGATNRPDSLDPALRRPGRFDRELFFPPPNVAARREILYIHTRQWMPPPTYEVLDHFAKVTNGYLGSDLSGLCSEAVLKALRRVYPEIYSGNYAAMASISRSVQVTLEDMLEAKKHIQPAGLRHFSLVARQLAPQFVPLMNAQVRDIVNLVKQSFQFADPAYKSEEDVSSSSAFLLIGDCADTHLAPALLHHLEHCTVQELSMATLHSIVDSQERLLVSLFNECRRSDQPSIIFLSNIPAVWEQLNGTGSSLLLELWKTRAAGNKTLLFATSNMRYDELPDEIQEIFPAHKDCSYCVRKPTTTEVLEFFEPVLSAVPPVPAEQKTATPGPPSVDPEASSSANLNIHERERESNRKRRHHDHYYRSHDQKRAKHMKDSHVSISDEDERTECRYENKQCTDIGKFMRVNINMLCRLGLEALVDLHSQFGKVLHTHSSSQDIAKKHQDLYLVTLRYFKMSAKKK